MEMALGEGRGELAKFLVGVDEMGIVRVCRALDIGRIPRETGRAVAQQTFSALRLRHLHWGLDCPRAAEGNPALAAERAGAERVHLTPAQALQEPVASSAGRVRQTLAEDLVSSDSSVL